jgi:hypothetical protein
MILADQRQALSARVSRVGRHEPWFLPKQTTLTRKVAAKDNGRPVAGGAKFCGRQIPIRAGEWSRSALSFDRRQPESVLIMIRDKPLAVGVFPRGPVQRNSASKRWGDQDPRSRRGRIPGLRTRPRLHARNAARLGVVIAPGESPQAIRALPARVGPHEAWTYFPGN